MFNGFKSLVLLVLLSISVIAKGQQPNSTAALMDSLKLTLPELSATVTLSVGEAGIQDFLRGVASSSGVNISVDPNLRFTVSNSFTNVKVSDLLIYLSQQYNLKITAVGNIFTVSAQEVPVSVPVVPPSVIYDAPTDKLSLDFQNVELATATREITKATGYNFVLLPGSELTRVSGFVQQMPLDNALKKFGISNNFNVSKTPDGFYVFETLAPAYQPQQINQQPQRSFAMSDTPLIIEANSVDSISIDVSNVSISEIISNLLNKLSLDYNVLDPLNGVVTLKLSKMPIDRLLDYLFKGTQYTYAKQGRSYWFGSINNPELKETRIIRLENRTVEKLREYIPESMAMGVTIKEYIDQNSILVTGTRPKISQLESFLNQMDKKIPDVTIEVIMIEVNNNAAINTGINATLGDGSVKPVTSGQVYPTANVTLNSQSINDMLSKLNGFGSLNIGKVTPNFYVTLSAMESNGMVDIHSTPKLSTLNGHEATLKIGSTEYYKEMQSSYFGSLTTQLNTQYSYKAVDADLSVKITPYVSGDDQITLDIEVKQTDFSGTKLDTNAPPNSLTRNFKSVIRVRNEDMILLGGLEQKKSSNSGQGVPLLSRIWGLRWLFSSRQKSTSSTKLNLFIRPTIVY